jgi:hypothetical protein
VAEYIDAAKTREIVHVKLSRMDHRDTLRKGLDRPSMNQAVREAVGSAAIHSDVAARDINIDSIGWVVNLDLELAGQ